MKRVWGQLKEFAAAMWQNEIFRKRLLVVVAVFIFLQVYFVRELLAAELLFGLVFAILLVLSVIFYMVGAIGERGLDSAEKGLRVVAGLSRQGYNAIGALNKKPVRHPHSESAP